MDKSSPLPKTTFALSLKYAVDPKPTVEPAPIIILPVNVAAAPAIFPTVKSIGGEILVLKPARLDALDILFYFLVIYQDSIAVKITLNVVGLTNAGYPINLSASPLISLENVATPIG